MLAVRTGIAAAVVVVLVSAAPAAAQAPTHTWSDGTTINLFGGVSADGDQASGLLGAGAGWAVTPRFALEGRVGWADGVGATDTFAASLSARCSPRRPRTAVPFVRAGVGLYRVTFDTAAALPRFYGRRLGPDDLVVSRNKTMIDPTVLAGAGIDLYASRRVAIRPEFDVTLVLDGTRGYAVTTATVHVVYHFEARRVTP